MRLSVALDGLGLAMLISDVYDFTATPKIRLLDIMSGRGIMRSKDIIEFYDPMYIEELFPYINCSGVSKPYRSIYWQIRLMENLVARSFLEAYDLHDLVNTHLLPPKSGRRCLIIEECQNMHIDPKAITRDFAYQSRTGVLDQETLDYIHTIDFVVKDWL